jgi:hypothetical protein
MTLAGATSATQSKQPPRVSGVRAGQCLYANKSSRESAGFGCLAGPVRELAGDAAND